MSDARQPTSDPVVVDGEQPDADAPDDESTLRTAMWRVMTVLLGVLAFGSWVLVGISSGSTKGTGDATVGSDGRWMTLTWEQAAIITGVAFGMWLVMAIVQRALYKRDGLRRWRGDHRRNRGPERLERQRR